MKLFNKGIYKSTIKRFAWGSVFYFVILFMITGMNLLINETPRKAYVSYMTPANATISFLRDTDILIPGVVVGIVTVLIMAMLVYRFVHAKKQTIFTHALPVKREANFISAMLAGLTLMAAPIILNGIILVIFAFCGYGYCYGIADCLVWMGINLLCVFVLFAYSTLAAMLTGNTFAVAALNLLLHIGLILIAAGFGSIASAFLYGYADVNSVLNFLCENNPVVSIFAIVEDVYGYDIALDIPKFALHVLAAVVVYVLAFVIYKKRKMETSGDVAPFAILNPIYKYLVTTLASLSAFGIFSSIGTYRPQRLIIGLVLVSAIAYFGCEMALKKTLRVWKSYKGYLGFGAVFTLMLALFCFTSFFGFETRVPDIEDIDSVAVYNYYYRGEEPFVDDEAVEQLAINIHKEFISGNDAKDKWFAGDERATNLNIKYKLKNGQIIHRRYGIDNDKKREIMNELYKYEEYKIANETVFYEGLDNTEEIILASGRADIVNPEQAKAFVECVRADVLALDYNQMHMDYIDCWGPKHVSMIYPESWDSGGVYYMRQNIPTTIDESRFVELNANYKNSIKWLRDNGYFEKIALKPQGTWYICENLVDMDYEDEISSIKRVSEPLRVDERYKPIYKISDINSLNVAAEFIYNYEIRETNNARYYTIIECTGDKSFPGGSYSEITDIDEFAAKVLINETNAEVITQ